MVRAGKSSARVTTRARILLKTTDGWSASRVAQALDVAEGTVFRVKRRFAEEGLSGALKDRPQAKRYRKLDDRSEAHLIALAFGLPGTGKTHALCALGHRLVEAGHSVLFAPAYRLVQELLVAKRDLDLPHRLRKLDNFDFLLLDALGYLPQGTEESEVLFTLIAERYERRSLGITSDLVFSEGERIFANPMATAAAIDRVVHHSVILEFDVPSYRTNAAQQRGQAEEVNRQN